MRTIQKYAQYISLICYLMLISISLPLYKAAQALATEIVPHMTILPLWVTLLEIGSWALHLLIPALLEITALVYLIILMHHFKQGETFSSHVTLLMQKIYRIALAWVIVSLLRYSFHLDQFKNGHGKFSMSLSFTDTELLNIMLIMLLALVTAILRSGNELKTEHDLTV